MPILDEEYGEKSTAWHMYLAATVVRFVADTLLLPQAKSERAWLPTETGFMRRKIENPMTGYSIDPARIVIFGADGSGAMAFLTAFQHRDLIRGVASLNGPISARAPMVFNEPLQLFLFPLPSGRSTCCRNLRTIRGLHITGK